MRLLASFLFVSSLCHFVVARPQVYFIAPASGDCTLQNGTTLTPCYTLQQLNSILQSAEERQVMFTMLPGTHTLTQLLVSNFSQVVIRPWIQEEEVHIQCLSKSHGGQNFEFQGVFELNLSSLHFITCSLHCDMNSELARSINIEACIFERSERATHFTTEG